MLGFYINTIFWYDDIRLSQAQFILSIVLGIGGIIVAWYIFKRQIDLSREQLELAKRQFEVDSIRYAIDLTTQNRMEIISQIKMAKDMAEQSKTKKEEAEHMKAVHYNDSLIPGLEKRIKELIKKYHRLLDRNPMQFKLEEGTYNEKP